MATKAAAYTPSMSDDAVQAKTGKTWAEWFALLDADGAERLDHKGIVALLRDQYGVGSWWQQMVTVTYEQARGRRERHETPAGYQVSVSRTVGVPLARLYAAWVLARLGDLRGRPTLEEMLQHAEMDVRVQATWTLGQFEDPGGIVSLRRALMDEALPVRWQAAWALAAKLRGTEAARKIGG